MRIVFFAVLVSACGLTDAAYALNYGSLMPSGSYYLTCQGCGYSQGILACACRRIDGSWRYTRLPYGRYCPSATVQNIDGNLRCD